MSAPTPLDRMWEAFRALVRGELAELPYLGAYRYVVRASALGTVDAEPATTTLGLPSVLRAPVLPGVMGETSTATVGAECVVMFLDGDPTLPRVLSITGVDEARIAGGTAVVGRVGDAVEVTLVALPVTGGGGGTVSGTASGTITASTSKAKA